MIEGYLKTKKIRYKSILLVKKANHLVAVKENIKGISYWGVV